VIVAFIATPLRAQVTVSRLEVVITPVATERVIATFVVRNDGDHAAQGILTREDWDRAVTGENRFAQSGSSPTSCGASMSVYPMSFRIEPGADQIVRIAVEHAASPQKECWDIVFVEELPQQHAQTRSGLQYTLRTGVKVYVVPAGLERDASITNMTVEPIAPRTASRLDASTAPATRRITIQFSNDGSVHLAAKGRIEFRRLDNSIAMSVPIAEFPTLPGAIRRLEMDVPPTLPAGSYVVLALIDFGGAEIAAGQLELDIR
jgi:P pilus assembly chaperone PapD